LKTLFIILTSLSFAFKSLASAPAQGRSISDFKSFPLTITLEKGLTLQFIGRVGGAPITFSKGQMKIKTIRKGFNDSHFSYVFIPSDKTLSPVIVKTTASQKSITLTKGDFKKIKSDEMWLWGVSNESNCPTIHGDPTAINFASYSVDHRHMNKRKTNQATGSFAMKVSLAKKPKHSTLYFSTVHHDLGATIFSEGFLAPADDISQSLCHAYYGSKCENLFLLNEKKFGHHYRVVFKKPLSEKVKKHFYSCPV
jgi:hypothetical protein